MQIDGLWFAITLDAVLGLSADKAQELSVLQVCARAVVVFAVLIFYVRIAKKRFLSSATAFDAILVIIIGSLASRAISGTAPFIASFAGTLTLILAHWLLSYISRDSPRLGTLIKGYSTKIIERGRVDEAARRQAHMSNDDLAEDLRAHGIESPADVKEARLERSGNLSVIKKDV
ncbi:hypothetical protein ASD45_00180 [Pseudolabrys sp. Root1462]|uniref:DUF421 domain-containing protein n=1 Tax=Pseudolabrys sp. Root1462 TaxID=1736466 RepID=UPI0007032B2B|nr:YetF domain-containing protein [Pseudolabrys sp. Root1462]KQY99390.1 hypothetical protein ASD45_00180 [Pseudolabrys sp. Root1462]